MNISRTAAETGLSTKTIRYYETVGLIPEPHRKDNGYRDYDTNDIKQLRFLRQARDFGFSIEECRPLLSLYQNPERKSAQVHQLVEKKLQDVDQRMLELQSMRNLLDQLITGCANDAQADCSIIDSMSGQNDEGCVETNKHLTKSRER